MIKASLGHGLDSISYCVGVIVQQALYTNRALASDPLSVYAT